MEWCLSSRDLDPTRLAGFSCRTILLSGLKCLYLIASCNRQVFMGSY